MITTNPNGIVKPSFPEHIDGDSDEKEDAEHDETSVFSSILIIGIIILIIIIMLIIIVILRRISKK